MNRSLKLFGYIFTLSFFLTSVFVSQVNAQSLVEGDLLEIKELIPMSSLGNDPDTGQPYTELIEWFYDNSGHDPLPQEQKSFEDMFGVYALTPDVSGVYIGIGYQPNGICGAQLAYFDGGELTSLSGTLETRIEEDGINTIEVIGDKVFVAGTDPCINDGWDAGNLYKLDRQDRVVNKFRYESGEVQGEPEALTFVDHRTTDTNGKYSFDNLKPGTYVIKVIPDNASGYSFTQQLVNTNGQDKNSDANNLGEVDVCESVHRGGWTTSLTNWDNMQVDVGLTKSGTEVNLSPSAQASDQSYYMAGVLPSDSYQGMSIGDFVWEDANNNGIQDPGEPGIEGVRVELYSKDSYLPCVLHGFGFWADESGQEIYHATSIGNFNQGPIFHSTDGGETWEHVGDVPFERPYDIHKFGDRLYAFTRIGNYFKPAVYLWYSEDGGRSWANANIPIYGSSFIPRFVEFQGKLIMVGTDGAILDRLYVINPDYTIDTIYTPEISNYKDGAPYYPFANVNDKFLYFLNGNNTIIRTPDLVNFQKVAEFSNPSTVFFSLAYWPETDQLVMGSKGKGGWLYKIDDVSKFPDELPEKYPEVCDGRRLSRKECVSLVDLFTITNGENWTRNDGWLVNNNPCGWYGITCKDGKIRSIMLPSNNLDGSLSPHINKADFTVFSGLQYIDMSNNNLSGVYMYFGENSRLKTIDLSYNNLETNNENGLGKLRNLRELYLNDNSWMNLTEDTVSSLINLRILNLSNNIVFVLPDNLAELVNLEELYVSGADLTLFTFFGIDIDFGGWVEGLGRLEKLRILDLSKNGIWGEFPVSILELAKYDLEYLDLSDNALICDLNEEILSLSSLNGDNFNIQNNFITTPIGNQKIADFASTRKVLPQNLFTDYLSANLIRSFTNYCRDYTYPAGVPTPIPSVTLTPTNTPIVTPTPRIVSSFDYTTTSPVENYVIPNQGIKNGDLMLLAVAVRDEDAEVSVDGLGLDWQEIVDMDNIQKQGGISVFAARGTSTGYVGDVMVNLSKSTNLVASSVLLKGVAEFDLLKADAGPVSDNNDVMATIQISDNTTRGIAFAWHRTKTLLDPPGINDVGLKMNSVSGTSGDTTRLSSWYQDINGPGEITLGSENNLSGNHDWALVVIGLK